ncbi:MAG: hypothetical protein RR939_08970 [Acinetobacter sp.]
MAVADQTPYIEYTANGVTTSFALGFDCEKQEHLIVTVNGVEPIVGSWSLTGGAVVFPVAPINTAKIIIQRNTPFERNTDYQSYNNSFRPPSVNNDFDRVWLKLQELGVMDWLLGIRIDDLKNYVDDRDDELRAYLMEEIRKQGVALDQLDEYYNYLMQRLVQIAVDKGWDASFVVDASGKTQQQLNEITKSLYNFNPDPTASISSQPSVLDYLQTLPLNTASGAVQTPKGFANGGVIRIPKGRYLVTEPIKLKRGTRIVGESHESTQIISRSLTGVFVYEDDGGYIPDEIVFENISIWQDAAYVPTAGAAIQVKEGAYTTSVQFILKNVMIEGTYKGVEVISGIACSLDNVIISKAINKGIDINNKGNNALSTTSTTLKNTYTSLCGEGGVSIVGSSYVSLIGTASDSNTGYGYNIVAANAINLIGVGAERNTLGNVYMKDITSANLAGHFITQTGAVNGIVLNNVSGLTIIGTNLLADAGNTGNAVHFEASAKPVLIVGGTTQNFANKSNNLNNTIFLNGQSGTGIIRGGDTNNWTFGLVAVTDKTAQIANVGTAETTTIHGFKNVITYTSAGTSYNTGTFNQVVTAAAAVTYPLIVGQYIENAFSGAGSTITRSAGQYIKEQTRGSTANANLMIDGGAGTVPAGNWSIYNDSTRPNYFKGPLTLKPSTSVTPSNNGDMTFELTSDTQLKIKVRGSDGVVRSATLTLA